MYPPTMENGWVKEQNVLHSFLRDYTEFKVHMTLTSALEFGQKFTAKIKISQTINISRNLTLFLLLNVGCVAGRSHEKGWIVNPLYGTQMTDTSTENQHTRECRSKEHPLGVGA